MKREDLALVLLNACENLDKRILGIFDSHNIELGELWNKGSRLPEKLPLSENVRQKLVHLRNDNWVESEVERCRGMGVRLVTILDDLYPESLRETPWAPLVLYIRGRWPFPEQHVGVVGTRKCSSYARRVSHALGKKIALAGMISVSGGAKGVDGSVHSGAIDMEAPTVSVLGTGVDMVYPRGHEELFEKISSTGALVSEYPLGTGAANWRFPKRNRIIAGISERLVVVEAPSRSGAMITARYAMELGREVWAVPGRIDENIARGSNGLIFDGAYPLVDIDHFLDSFSGEQLDLFNSDFLPVKPVEVSDEQLSVLSLLRERGERTVDNIASECKMSAAEVLNFLGLLAARGDVYPSGPGRWSASLEN